jgi:hypothetical protein
MVALQSAQIVTVPLESIVHRLKLVEPELYTVAKTVIGGKR